MMKTESFYFNFLAPPIFIVNRKGLIVHKNQKWINQIGNKYNEIFSIIHPQDIKDYKEAIDRIRNKPEIILNIKIKNKILSYQNIRLKIIYNKQEDLIYNIVDEISQIDDLNDVLLTQELNSQTNSEAIWISYFKKDKHYWSNAFKKLLGFGPNEIKGSLTELLEIIHPEDKEIFLLGVKKHRQRLKNLDLEYRLLVKSGEFRCLNAKENLFLMKKVK